MLTAHKIKVLQSLDKKKFRQKYNLFLVEGNKTIVELQNSPYKITELFSVEPDLLSVNGLFAEKITSAELKKISQLQHPKDSVAVCELNDQKEIDTNINIVLDGIQDPGNLGTIIRLADWFGIQQIICSEDTVDLFNPKVIQASMGSFTRVNVVYRELLGFLSENENPSFGTDMDGVNIYDFSFPEKFNLIFGNEGNGMRSTSKEKVDQLLTIPRFGKNKMTESLNVSMSAGIILGQIFAKK